MEAWNFYKHQSKQLPEKQASLGIMGTELGAPFKRFQHPGQYGSKGVMGDLQLSPLFFQSATWGPIFPALG